jgi:hypothetical protein
MLTPFQRDMAEFLVESSENAELNDQAVIKVGVGVLVLVCSLFRLFLSQLQLFHSKWQSKQRHYSKKSIV